MARSINLFSQRYKVALCSKKITVSLPYSIIQTIYNLFEKHNSIYSYENYIIDVMNELRIYEPDYAQYGGVPISKATLKQFLTGAYPSKSLDAIEVFSTISRSDEFIKDINNLFYNNRLPYELVDNQIIIIPQISIPDSLTDDMSKLKEDIDSHIVKKEYSIVVDRLHTYYGYLLQSISQKLSLEPSVDENDHIILSATNKKIAEYLYEHKAITDFQKQELIVANSLLEKFNVIRNKETGAHPNSIINNDDAEFLVKTISANMLLLEKKVKSFLV